MIFISLILYYIINLKKKKKPFYVITSLQHWDSKKKKKLTTLLDVNYFKIFLIFYKTFSYRSLEHYPYAGPLLV